MSERRDITPDVKDEIGVIYNKICSVKAGDPGSEDHHQSMVELTEMLAKRPGALTAFYELQKIAKK